MDSNTIHIIAAILLTIITILISNSGKSKPNGRKTFAEIDKEVQQRYKQRRKDIDRLNKR